MRRLLIPLLFLLCLAGCSQTKQTPIIVSSSPTSETLPTIATASIPTPVPENTSLGNGGGEKDVEFDVDSVNRVVEKVVTALEDRDWETLFTFISSSHASHMTAEDFALSMSAQEDQFGKIVEVEILSTPSLLPETGGQVMFTVEIAVSYQKGERILVNRYLDYYTLEGGEWRVESSELSSN
jgi:hypothetical protein